MQHISFQKEFNFSFNIIAKKDSLNYYKLIKKIIKLYELKK